MNCQHCGVEFTPRSKGARYCSGACAGLATFGRGRSPDPTPEEIATRAAAIKAENLAAMQSKVTAHSENDGCEMYRLVPRKEARRHYVRGRVALGLWVA